MPGFVFSEKPIRLVRGDGPYLYADTWDCPMVTYGPGDSDLDHAPDERIDLAEDERTIAILEAVCETLVA
jgi:acetylornithine deacetylase/succinyl-diaminopimelate desuccinylase-like protein